MDQLCKNKIFLDGKFNYMNLKIKDEIEVLEKIKYNNIIEDNDYYNIE